MIKLKAAIKYGEEDLITAKNFVDTCPKDDPDTEINLGCLLYKVSFDSMNPIIIYNKKIFGL